MATEWGCWTRNGALPAFRRSTGPGPGGNRQGEGARGDQENDFPLVGRVLGQVWLYWERGKGGGRQRQAPR